MGIKSFWHSRHTIQKILTPVALILTITTLIIALTGYTLMEPLTEKEVKEKTRELENIFNLTNCLPKDQISQKLELEKHETEYLLGKISKKKLDIGIGKYYLKKHSCGIKPAL